MYDSIKVEDLNNYVSEIGNHYGFLNFEDFSDFKKSWGVKKVPYDNDNDNEHHKETYMYSLDNIFSTVIAHGELSTMKDKAKNVELSALLKKECTSEIVLSLDIKSMRLSCPSKLIDFTVKYFPLSAIINKSSLVYNSISHKTSRVMPLSFNNDYFNDNEKQDFINDFISLFPHENKEIITYLAYRMRYSGHLDIFVKNLSLFIVINNLISHYNDSNELVKLKNFNIIDNPMLVTNSYEDFNNLHIVINDYTQELLDLIFENISITRKSAQYSLSETDLNPISSLFFFELGNNTCIDFINIINNKRTKGNYGLTDFSTLYFHNDDVINIGKKLEKCEFMNMRLNRLVNSQHQDYVSTRTLRTMHECLIEIRNLIINNKNKNDHFPAIIDTVMNTKNTKNVSCYDIKKLYLIYAHTILLTHYNNNVYSYHMLKSLFYDATIFPNSMLENNIDTITEMIHLFIKSKGKVPFYLIENII